MSTELKQSIGKSFVCSPLGFKNLTGEGNGNPLQYSCLENPMDREAWWAIVSPWGGKESDMTERLHFHFQEN